jgi:hypothetical protein
LTVVSPSVSASSASAKAALHEPAMCGGLPAQQLIVQVCCADEKVLKGITPARSASARPTASMTRMMEAGISFNMYGRENKPQVSFERMREAELLIAGEYSHRRY